jgi:pyruvate formate lyase activating enzyme
MLPLFKKNENKLECLLCPHCCKLTKGATGICGVRRNRGENIELLTYGVLSGYSSDPVEKKPLYHFFPGYNVLSVGSYGCNMSCDFCQNFNISQKYSDHFIADTTPEKLTTAALSSKNNIGIAFTYNEPVIWFEFVRDVAILIKKAGLCTVMVSNGYINSDPLNEITGFTDAFNIDLKAFTDSFYRRLTGSGIGPVKDSLKQIARSGKHLEITTLIIPGQNDNEKEMALMSEWIEGELGPDVPLHLSRYYPMYKRDDPATNQETLSRLYDTALKNLNYVYTGNLKTETSQNTKCPECGTLVTIRTGYQTTLLNLNEEGKCSCCGNLIYSHFTISSTK